MPKKTTLLILLTAFVVGLIGCSSGTSNTNGGTSPNTGGQSGSNTGDQQITLSVTSYLSSEERIKMMDETIAIFNEKYPNVTVNHAADGGNYEQALKLSFFSGEGQDIVYLDDARQQMLQSNGYLMDITEDVKARGWLDKQVAGAIEYNNLRTPDTYYSAPFLMAPVVVFYNKEIFNELGVTPPDTVEQFEAIMEKAKAAGKIPMENAGLNNFNLMWSQFSVLFGQVDMQHVNDFYYLEGASPELDEAMVSSLSRVNNWVQQGYYRQDMSSIDYNAIPTLFAQGQTAMVVDGDWNLPTYNDMDFEVGVFAFPVTDPALPNTIVNSTDGAWGLNATLSPEKKEAALNFIEIFMEPEVVKIWSEGGLTSSVIVDSSSFNLSPLRQELNDAISDTNIGFYLDGALPGFTDVVVKETQKMMLGEITPDLAWTNIKAEYEKLKAQAEAQAQAS